MINKAKLLDTEFCDTQAENIPFSQVGDGAFTKSYYIHVQKDKLFKLQKAGSIQANFQTTESKKSYTGMIKNLKTNNG